MSTHPAIGITNEVSFFSVLEALRPAFSREVSFNNWQERTKSTKENWTKTTLEPYIPRYDKSAGRMVRAMYEAHFESPSIRYFGDKLPQYYEHDIDALESKIGPIHIVHISRNPIDVVNSMLRRSRNAAIKLDTWNLVHTVDEGCMHWARAWNAVQRLARSREFRVTHLKYEELISDPVGTLTKLSNVLGVSDAFDHTRIVEEDPLARDIVGGAFERIDELLGRLPGRWEESLEQLGVDFPHIPTS